MSFIVVLLVIVYTSYKVLVYVQDIPGVSIVLDIVKASTGIALQEEVDLQLEFDKNPSAY
jgi:hypothetical protein